MLHFQNPRNHNGSAGSSYHAEMPCRHVHATTRHPSGRYAHVLSQLYDNTACKRARQKSQSSSSVSTALPMTYELPEPEKKSWFSSAFGDRAARIAGFTSQISAGNSAG